MRRQTIDVLVRELARQGVCHWTVDRSHKHPRLEFVWHGKPVFYVLSGSASDWRAVLNMRADLRRMMRQ